MTPTTESEIEQCKDLWLRGYSMVAIAGRIGRHPQTVRKALGATRTAPRAKLIHDPGDKRLMPNHQQIDRILELYREGTKQIEIAARLGLSRQRINQIVKKYGN